MERGREERRRGKINGLFNCAFPPWVKETEEEEEEGLLPILSARKKKDTNRNSTIVQCLKTEKIKKTYLLSIVVYKGFINVLIFFSF